MFFEGYFILIICAAILINVIGAYLMNNAAEEKGYKDIHAMAICFWLGIFGYLYIITLPDKRLRQAIEEQNRMLAGNKAGAAGQHFTAAEYADDLPAL